MYWFHSLAIKEIDMIEFIHFCNLDHITTKFLNQQRNVLLKLGEKNVKSHMSNSCILKYLSKRTSLITIISLVPYKMWIFTAILEKLYSGGWEVPYNFKFSSLPWSNFWKMPSETITFMKYAVRLYKKMLLCTSFWQLPIM